MTDDEIDDFLKGAEYVMPLPSEITRDVIVAAVSRLDRSTPPVRNIVAAVATRYIIDNKRHLGPLVSKENRAEAIIAGFYLWDQFLMRCRKPHDVRALSGALAAHLCQVDDLWEICVQKAMEDWEDVDLSQFRG